MVDIIQVFEVDNCNYIDTLLDQYPNEEEVRELVHNHSIRKYEVIFMGKRAGALWITKLDINNKVCYMLEGYRDKRFSNVKNSFLAYKECAKLVLEQTYERPLMIKGHASERHTKLLARVLHFKPIGINHQTGFVYYKYEN